MGRFDYPEKLFLLVPASPFPMAVYNVRVEKLRREQRETMEMLNTMTVLEKRVIVE
jgi:hypothetical protein